MIKMWYHLISYFDNKIKISYPWDIPHILDSCGDMSRVPDEKRDWPGFRMISRNFPQPKMSNEKNPGYLLYIRDYTTRLCGDYHKPL